MSARLQGLRGSLISQARPTVGACSDAIGEVLLPLSSEFVEWNTQAKRQERQPSIVPCPTHLEVGESGGKHSRSGTGKEKFHQCAQCDGTHLFIGKAAFRNGQQLG